MERLTKADEPWLDGTERVAWVLTEPALQLRAEVSLVMGEVRGIVRLYRLPRALVYEKPIGLEEIVLFASDRQDLVDAFMEALVKEARPH